MEKGRRTQYLVALAVALSSLTAGVALNWSTPVIPKFHDHSAGINITTKEISWVAAIGSTGYMTGSLLTRFTSDVFGRRATILGSTLPILIGTVIILNSTTAWMIYVTRFSWGIGTGMLGTVSGIYLAEISDKEIRGTLSAANRFMLNFGSSLVMSIGPFVSFQALSYMLLVLPACYFVVCWFIPESPYYYLKEKKVDCARKALMTLTGNGDDKVLEDRLSEMRSHVRKEMLRSGSLKELFTGKQYRKAMIIVIGLKVTQLMAGSIAIQQYLGRIIQESSNDISVSTALIVYSAMRFIVGIFYLALVDRCRRRPLLFCTYLISSIILGVVGVCFFIDLSSLSYFSIIPFVGILLNAITSVMGYGPLGYLIPTEIFPINVKSVAMTTVNIFSGFLNFVSVKGYQEVKDLAGLSGVFWFYGSFAFAGAVFSYFVVPETKGKSLREIQIDLQGNMFDEAGEKLNPLVNLDVPEIKEKSVKESHIDLQENMPDNGDERLNEVVHLNNGASIQLRDIDPQNTST